MRKLMAMFAICVSVATAPAWSLVGLGDIKFDGSLEVSGNSASNETDQAPANDHRGNTATRVRLGMNALVTEGVTGRIEAIRDTRLYGTSPTTVQNETDLWRFHNAFIDIADLWGSNFRLGRQYIGNPGDLVWNISPTDDDSLTNNSIDGLLIQNRKLDFLHIDLFTGKASEDDGVANTDADDTGTGGDINLSSLDLVLPTLIPGGAINVGYLWGIDSSSAPHNNDNKLTTLRVGVRGGLMENFITYRAELFQNGGAAEIRNTNSELKYKGRAIDLGVGVNASETPIGGISANINWLMGSGDDDLTDNDDESFHDFSALGVNTSDRLLGEIFGKSNTLGGGTPRGQGLDATGASQNGGLSVINLGVALKPNFLDKKSTFKLDYYMFSQTEDSQKVAGGGTTNIGDDFGDEIDFAFLYDHTANVGIELGYAMLSPDTALTGVAVAPAPANPDEDITKAYARLKVKWGGEAQ